METQWGRIEARVAIERKVVWSAAARRCRKSFTEWMSGALDREVELAPPPKAEKPKKVRVRRKVVLLDPPLERDVLPLSKSRGECEHCRECAEMGRTVNEEECLCEDVRTP